MNASTPSAPRRADAAAVLFALLLPAALVWVYFVMSLPSPAIQRTAYTLGKLVQFGFPILWVVAVQRRRPTWKWPGRRGLLEGLVFGLLVSAGMLLLYHAWLEPAGHLDVARDPIWQRISAYGLRTLPRYVAFGAFLSVIHAFLEEYYWRWFVFGQLRRMLPLAPAIVVSSVGFMAHHVVVLAMYFGWLSPATWLFSLAVAVGGGVWAWIYDRSDSLYGPWLSHLLVDIAIFVVGYCLIGHLLHG